MESNGLDKWKETMEKMTEKIRLWREDFCTSITFGVRFEGKDSSKIKVAFQSIGCYTQKCFVKIQYEEARVVKKTKGIIMFLVTAAAMFALTGCGSTTVDLNKYITIECSGYDSVGTASYVFDYDAFNEDYSGKIKINSDNGDEVASLGLLSGETPSELLLDICVSQSLSQTGNLSNGDVITLQWNCEDDMVSEYFNCELSYSDIEYTVSGLEEVATFNPFDYVEVSFSGTSPNGSVTVTPNYNQSEIQYINFTTDKYSGLKNGDTVVVTASISGSIDTFVEKYGSVLGQTEKTYTVDSLPYYVTDIADIPQDMMDKMDKQAQDVFRAYVANVWDKPENLNSISLIGNYFLTAKPGMSVGTNNYVYMVYKITATNPDPVQDVEFYYYVCFNNVMKLGDGTCSVDLSSYTKPDSGWFATEVFSVGTYTYSGYDNLDSLFNNQVVTKIETYEYTSTVQE